MKRLTTLSVLFILICSGLRAEGAEIVIAAWNVENLFDTLDDPDNEGDDAYTPGGWAEWTENRYRHKLQNLAEVIADIKPDILALSEVENRRVLQDLSAVLATNFNFYLGHIIHRDGEDFRGIDVAMMARYEPARKCWFNAVSGQRDVLACSFKIAERELTVVVNHWKSKLGKPEYSDAIRLREAASVRGFIDRELALNPAAAIVVAGDFNADFDSAFLVDTAGFLIDREELRKEENRGKLYNLAADIPSEERATYYYLRGKQWNSFDSISVTRGMLGMEPVAPWRVRPGSYQVYRPEKVTFRGVGSPLPFRRVRSKAHGDRYVTGYSDHFAVSVVLE